VPGTGLMSWVRIPDPYPGRCLNYRASVSAIGEPTNKRCLDYEDHDGKCRFEPDPPPTPTDWGSSGIYQSTTPKPWVSPL
jgi:hypothetical protein